MRTRIASLINITSQAHTTIATSNFSRGSSVTWTKHARLGRRGFRTTRFQVPRWHRMISVCSTVLCAVLWCTVSRVKYIVSVCSCESQMSSPFKQQRLLAISFSGQTPLTVDASNAVTWQFETHDADILKLDKVAPNEAGRCGETIGVAPRTLISNA